MFANAKRDGPGMRVGSGALRSVRDLGASESANKLRGGRQTGQIGCACWIMAQDGRGTYNRGTIARSVAKRRTAQ
jgi:hypothetical protein